MLNIRVFLTTIMKPNDNLEHKITDANHTAKFSCFVLDISNVSNNVLRNLSIWNNKFENVNRDSYIKSMYNSQDIYYTNFQDLYDLMSLSVENVSAYIEIRSDSNLLIIQVDKGINPMRNIVSDINYELKSEISNLNYKYSEICDFARYAESIKAESPTFEDSNEIVNKIRSGNDLPIERAKLKHTLNNKSFFITFDNMKISLPIYSDSKTHSNRREYIIQILESCLNRTP